MKTKSRKHKIAKKREQGRRNYQRKIDHERKLQQQLGTKIFGYWQFPIYGDSAEEVFARSRFFGDWQPKQVSLDDERLFFIEVAIKDDVHGRTYVTDMRVGPCRFSEIYGAVLDNMDEIRAENPKLTPNGYTSYARVRT